MSEDIAVASALLVAEGLVEQVDREEGGLRVTQKGYEKGYNLWMAMNGEDRLLIALFLRKVRLI